MNNNAHAAENPIPGKNKNHIRYIAVTGILSAAAFALQLIEIPLPMLIPSFIKFDFSDLPALIGAFSLGPLSGILIQFIKNLIHSAISTTSFVGELSNFLLGSVFVGTAGLIYKFRKTKSGAAAASLIGALLMAGAALPLNYFIVYPFYYNFMPEQTILAAYQSILPGMKSIFQSLICFNVPFTFGKGIADALVTFLIYKRISPLLKGKAGNQNKR
ncbi:MAG: ECF transporter S component [Clostridiales bacterium]|jgi:riboflavin transporter FmnP|nr:ECF transporter S component [Clostridiales bacterium]